MIEYIKNSKANKLQNRQISYKMWSWSFGESRSNIYVIRVHNVFR